MRLIVLALTSALCTLPACADTPANVTTLAGNYQDVKDNLTFAIEGRGLVINNIAHVGAMLDRTAADLGKGKRVYDQAEVFEFCSASVSRAVMEADPRNIVYCPYTIAVYTVPGQSGKVFLAYRPLPPALDAVNQLLRGILADTLK